ncbi:Mod_r domain-containing protein [Cinnamomum micranthum f. kanehirae]|uniref:Mod_r domain-containing protein n=1 Tax=Cinnamomum micranthum f. kanehirae TaxID=337451 RepID=A0A3S3P6S6_9MAGN|nr:Mod_r domain-containing protein [Cinnamomum micranthum f. kanehirae]
MLEQKDFCKFICQSSNIDSFQRGSSEQNQPPQEIPTQSWYPPSVVGSSSNSSRPSTASSSQHQRASDQSHGQFSPTAAASVIGLLKDKRQKFSIDLAEAFEKYIFILPSFCYSLEIVSFIYSNEARTGKKSVDELRKLLTDKDAYNTFLHSLDQVKIQNNLRDELRKETMQLARENLEKEPRILELRNQCRIIRTTELAAAQEKLNGLEMKKEELLRLYSPSMLLQKMQDAINKAEEESEILHRQLLDKEIDLSAFVQKYKKLRTINHRRALIHLAAKTSSE